MRGADVHQIAAFSGAGSSRARRESGLNPSSGNGTLGAKVASSIDSK